MSTAISTGDLAKRWASLKQDSPSLRARDAAELIGCSEGELLAAAAAKPGIVPGLEVSRLGGKPSEVFLAVPDLGRVMALTRNEAVVSETYGVYADIEHHGNRGLVHADGIDLRLDFSHWHHCFAVRVQAGKKERLSLQFFDVDGTAVHKVHLTDDSDVQAFERIVADAEPDATGTPAAAAGATFGPAKPSADRQGSDQVDPEELRARWAELTNVHQFSGMLRKLGIRRLAAVRAVGRAFAEPVAADSYRALFSAVKEGEVPVMVFVRSPGCTQIYKGTIGRLMDSGEYFNVFDPEFHLHMREPRLAEAWVVRKPTAEDTVTALEVYGADGELCLQVFGVRDDEGHESPDWRACVESLVGNEG